MKEAFARYLRKTYGEPLSSTRSQALESGVTLSASQESATTLKSGPAPLPASHGLPQEMEMALTTTGTSGLSSSGSSASAALQSSLWSRCRALLDSSGSTLWSMTWKERVTPSGRRILQRRASARRTSDSDCSSWPTPQAADGLNGHGGQAQRASSGRSNLIDTVMLASWPTPTVGDSRSSGRHTTSTGVMHPGTTLTDAARLAPWATPTTRDFKYAN